MPSELQRVAQGLLECIDQVPTIEAALLRRAVRLRELAAQVAGMRSQNPGATTAALELDAAAQACERAAQVLSLVPAKARAWTEQMVSGARTADGSSAPAPVGSGEPRDLDVRRLELLPEWKKGDKTRGYRLGAPPGSRLFSGNDEYQQKARELIRERRLGPAPWHSLAIDSHVEVKFAIMMREHNLTNETIVINKIPCGPPEGCQDYLEDLLPPGARLTVIAPKYKHTFIGRREDQA